MNEIIKKVILMGSQKEKQILQKDEKTVHVTIHATLTVAEKNKLKHYIIGKHPSISDWIREKIREIDTKNR